MAKGKKFRHTTPRPTLAASLEAVRQGKALASTPPPESVEGSQRVETKPAPIVSSTNEAAFVKTEIKRIGLIVGLLLVFLLVLSIAESRTGFLTRFVGQYF